jgi:hypothetical protein
MIMNALVVLINLLGFALGFILLMLFPVAGVILLVLMVANVIIRASKQKI